MVTFRTLFYIYADPDLDLRFHCNADPDPAYQNNADPHPQPLVNTLFSKLSMCNPRHFIQVQLSRPENCWFIAGVSNFADGGDGDISTRLESLSFSGRSSGTGIQSLFSFRIRVRRFRSLLIRTDGKPMKIYVYCTSYDMNYSTFYYFFLQPDPPQLRSLLQARTQNINYNWYFDCMVLPKKWKYAGWIWRRRIWPMWIVIFPSHHSSLRQTIGSWFLILTC